MALTDEQKKLKHYKQHLTDLTRSVAQAVDTLDTLGKAIKDKETGECLVHVVNSLEMAKDLAEHFGLGKPFKKK